MKQKLITIIIIGVLLLSTLDMALGATSVCPNCQGTGQVKCPTCGGSGKITSGGGTGACTYCGGDGYLTPSPTVVSKSAAVLETEGITRVTVAVKNQLRSAITGQVTGTLDGHPGTSPTMTFEPNAVTTATLDIPYIATSYTSSAQLIEALQISFTGFEEIECPYCHGTGVATTLPTTTTCPDCSGTGYISCPNCGGTGYVDSSINPTNPTPGGGGGGTNNSFSLPTGTIEAIVVAVVIICAGLGGFMFVRKRSPNEQKLRRMPARDFNDWVLKRVEGTAPSSRDASMGIDGYTRSGQALLIKQSDDVGSTVIDNFSAALARNRAHSGVIVAFGFGADAIRGKVRAKTAYRIDIETMTVQDLIDRRSL